MKNLINQKIINNINKKFLEFFYFFRLFFVKLTSKKNIYFSATLPILIFTFFSLMINNVWLAIILTLTICVFLTMLITFEFNQKLSSFFIENKFTFSKKTIYYLISFGTRLTLGVFFSLIFAVFIKTTALFFYSNSNVNQLIEISNTEIFFQNQFVTLFTDAFNGLLANDFTYSFFDIFSIFINRLNIFFIFLLENYLSFFLTILVIKFAILMLFNSLHKLFSFLILIFSKYILYFFSLMINSITKIFESCSKFQFDIQGVFWINFKRALFNKTILVYQ